MTDKVEPLPSGYETSGYEALGEYALGKFAWNRVRRKLFIWS